MIDEVEEAWNAMSIGEKSKTLRARRNESLQQVANGVSLKLLKKLAAHFGGAVAFLADDTAIPEEVEDAAAAAWRVADAAAAAGRVAAELDLIFSAYIRRVAEERDALRKENADLRSQLAKAG